MNSMSASRHMATAPRNTLVIVDIKILFCLNLKKYNKILINKRFSIFSTGEECLLVVSTANAVIQIDAMMIKVGDTLVAFFAVFGLVRDHHLTYITKLIFYDMFVLLAVKVIRRHHFLLVTRLLARIY